MKKLFKTADVILAAVILSATEAHLNRVEHDESETLFVFEQKYIHKDLIAAYTDGLVRVEPMAFSMILKYVVVRALEYKNDKSE